MPKVSLIQDFISYTICIVDYAPHQSQSLIFVDFIYQVSSRYIIMVRTVVVRVVHRDAFDVKYNFFSNTYVGCDSCCIWSNFRISFKIACSFTFVSYVLLLVIFLECLRMCATGASSRVLHHKLGHPHMFHTASVMGSAFSLLLVDLGNRTNNQ